MDKKLKGLEIAGAVFVFVCGTLMHFLYEWSNKNVVGILFGAVNESVWERYRACFFNRVLQAVCCCQGFWSVLAVYINNQLLLPVFLNYRLQYFMA